MSLLVHTPQFPIVMKAEEHRAIYQCEQFLRPITVFLTVKSAAVGAGERRMIGAACVLCGLLAAKQ